MRPLLNALVVIALLGATSGCAATASNADVPADFVVGGDRPATVYVPEEFDPQKPAPLLLMLHGFGSSAPSLEAWAALREPAGARGWLVVAPDGTTDTAGDQFWNAGTPGCCNLFDSDVDDSGYLSALIDEVADTVAVDPARVYVFGHSNGGFMTYRMACDHADQIAAVVTVAGVTIPEDICSPSEPVNVLQIHGTADTAVPYDGSGGTASAEEMALIWAAHDGCEIVADTSGAPLDLDKLTDGAETTTTVYDQGCGPGGSATLWTIDGGQHQPILSDDFRGLVLDYFEAHPQPAG